MRYSTALALMGATVLWNAPALSDFGDQLFKLVAPGEPPEARFGFSVAIGDSHSVVGALSECNAAGAAYIFDTDTGVMLHKLTSVHMCDADVAERFGIAVAIREERVLIGAHHNDSNARNSGAAYLFDASTGQQVRTFFASDPEQGDVFGQAVAIDGTTALIGAPLHDGAEFDEGAAYLFNTDSGQQIARLMPAELNARATFGMSVAVSGGAAVVGAPAQNHDDETAMGAVYIFDASTGAQRARLLAPDGVRNDLFGTSVAILGDLVIVGAPKHDSNGLDAGAAYLFSISTGQMITKLVAADGGIDDQFGSSVGIDVDIAIVGAPQHDHSGSDSGGAYIFDITTGQQLAELLPDDGATLDRLGQSVGVNDGVALVGAPFDDGLEGAAYLFNAGDRDTDGDGLLDSWENDGIPYLGTDGQIHRYVLDIDGDGISDADPEHKDLFLEVDLMVGLTLSQDIIDDVELAFASAPVENPDLIAGIDLHIFVDDQTIPFEQETVTPPDSFPTNAGQLKFEFFGTQAERNDPDALGISIAKRSAFRYAMVMNQASRQIGGHAELGGDDMILYLGGFSDINKASALMHEFGHCLGLHHGGGDTVNGKPNYPSVMNYVLAYRGSWNETFWKLDYSREKLDTIDENSVSELVSVGSGGSGRYNDFFMPFHGIVPAFADCHDEDLWGESLISYADLDPAVLTDLDLDCDTDDTGFAADLNFVPGSALPGSEVASPGETLVGFNDWEIIVLAVSDGGGSYAIPDDRHELTIDQVQYMEDNFPLPPRDCPADLDGDGDADADDFFAYLDAFAGGDTSVCDIDIDGDCDADDFFGYLDLFAGGC